MRKRKATVCLLSVMLAVVLLVSCCGRELYTVENISGSYSRENTNGFDHFTITLNENGTYSYFETMISSHLGMGGYTLEDGVVTLTDSQIPGLYGSLTRTYRFRCEDGKLIFLADESDNFMYIKLPDGAEFDRREPAAEQVG